MPPEHSDEPRSPEPPPKELREFVVAFGVVLAIMLVGILLVDWFDWAIKDSDMLRQSGGLGPRPVRPRRPLEEQVGAILLCLFGAIVLAKGRRVDRPLDRWLPVVLFGLAGAITLWVSAVGLLPVLRVGHLLIGLGCFGLAALSCWLRSRL